MNKEFVPYDIALAMKELGFNEPCLAAYYITDANGNPKNGELSVNSFSEQYSNTASAPLYQQAFGWFEDNYDDAITIRTYKMSNGVRWYDYSVNEFGGRSKSKEEAELTCLRKLIEIVKENL